MNRSPYTVIHPGEILKDELIARHITQKHFATLVDVPYTMLNEILNGKRSVSVDFALLVEASLGIKAYMLVNLQCQYSLDLARQDKNNNRRLAKIRSVCASLL